MSRIQPWRLAAPTLFAFASVVALPVSAAAQVVINEIDYDQSSTDPAEWCRTVRPMPVPAKRNPD